ncbi:MAG: Kelch repeat-containing protein [Gammaproteobacteria bacterium]
MKKHIAPLILVCMIGFSGVAQAGFWKKLADLPDPDEIGLANGETEGAAVSGVGDIMVVLSGYDGFLGDVPFARRYDIIANTWSIGTPAPFTATEPAYGETGHGGKVYLVGGRTFGSEQKLQQYDVFNDSWTVLSDMPTGRAAAAAAIVGNNLYVMGGRFGSAPCSGGFFDTVERYDIDKDMWEEVASLPTPRSDFTAMVVGNKIYVFGGCNGSGDIDDVDVYNPITDSWSSDPADLSVPRSSLMSGKKGRYVYVMGGSVDGFVSGLNERYDTVKDKWTHVTPMPTDGCPERGRGETGAYSHDGKIYVPGGGCPAFGTPTNVNWSFKP